VSVQITKTSPTTAGARPGSSFGSDPAASGKTDGQFERANDDADAGNTGSSAEAAKLRYFDNLVDCFDKDGSGELGPKELSKMLSKLTGQKVSETDALAVLSVLDTDDSKGVSGDELNQPGGKAAAPEPQRAIARHDACAPAPSSCAAPAPAPAADDAATSPKSAGDDYLDSLIGKYDGGDGRLDAKELSKLLSDMGGQEVSEEAAQTVIDQFAADPSKGLSRDELRDATVALGQPTP
jgi:Ca2+-binding EF-hand superfamily protein